MQKRMTILRKIMVVFREEMRNQIIRQQFCIMLIEEFVEM
jgi:hypothetical protein